MIGHRQGIIRAGFFARRRAEKNGFGRAVQEPRDATLARGRKDDLRTAAIDRMKIALLPHPHTGQTGKMIDLFDAAQGFPYPVRIEHGAFDIINLRLGPGRRVNIQHTHLETPGDERRYQMLSDESAAAGNQYRGHEFGCVSP